MGHAEDGGVQGLKASVVTTVCLRAAPNHSRIVCYDNVLIENKEGYGGSLRYNVGCKKIPFCLNNREKALCVCARTSFVDFSSA